jgi:hypothetical protein
MKARGFESRRVPGPKVSGGRCVEQAQGILVAALGVLAGYYGYARDPYRQLKLPDYRLGNEII